MVMRAGVLRARLHKFGVTAAGGSPIGTPVEVINGSDSSGLAPAVFALTAGVAIGHSLILVAHNATSAMTISSITDTAGNTWVAGTPTTADGTITQFFGTVVTNTLTTSDTVSITFSSTAGVRICIGIDVPNMAASTAALHDVSGTGTTAVSGNPNATVTPSSANQSLVLAGTMLFAGAGGDTWTESAGFTTLTPTQIGAETFRLAYQVVSSTSAVNYSATNSPSREWTVLLDVFKGA